MSLLDLVPGVSQAKLIIGGLLIVGLLTTAGTFFYKWNAMKAEIAEQHAVIAAQDLRGQEQDKTIKQQALDISIQKAINEDLQDQRNKARANVEEMQAKFNKLNRDFGKMAQEKPGMIQSIINRGTQNILRCFEILSGNPLTQEEKNAKVANPACPDLYVTPSK